MATPARTVTADDVARAREFVVDVAKHTPVLPSQTLSDRTGAKVELKAENLQRTGSFKLRGALNKLGALGPACANGVTAGSAGNHAWALAQAAAVRGVPCEVFMPDDAPLSKAEGCRSLGAIVRVGGASVEDCVALAQARAEEAGMAFVHPFDDPDVVAGQGTLGLELLEDVPDLARVIVPVGGGGLASGMAIAIKSARPEVEVVGVQVDTMAVYREALRDGTPGHVERALTIADGIAVKRPGELTFALIREWLDEIVVGARRRGRRGDGAADGARQARGRGRGRRRRRRAARRAGDRGAGGHHRRRAQRRQRRSGPAGVDRAAPRDRGRPAPGRLHARARPPRLARAAARAAWGRRAPTSSTSSTCAKASTSTCARPRCSSCSRRAGASSRRACSTRIREAGYEARVVR